MTSPRRAECSSAAERCSGPRRSSFPSGGPSAAEFANHGDGCTMRASRTASPARVEHELAKIESGAEGVRPNIEGNVAEKVRDENWGAVDLLSGELLGDSGEEREPYG